MFFEHLRAYFLKKIFSFASKIRLLFRIIAE